MRGLRSLFLATVSLCSGASLAQQGAGTAYAKVQQMEGAKGHFEIMMKPEAGAVDGVSRSSFTKSFHGDMEGTSTGELLSLRTATPGSAGYVLIERVSATLRGKTGSFAVQQFGLMDRKKPELRAEIIPDFGTGELIGIKGRMTINPADNHSYMMSYSMPSS